MGTRPIPTPFGEVGVSDSWVGIRPVMVTVVCLVLAKSLGAMAEATRIARRRARDAGLLVRSARAERHVGEAARAELRHDASNALAGIRAALWMLCDQAARPESTAALGHALESELDHLEQLILGTDQPDGVDSAVDDLVRDAALLYRLQGVDVHVRSQPAMVRGRPADVRRDLENLLVNAQRRGAGAVTVCTPPPTAWRSR